LRINRRSMLGSLINKLLPKSNFDDPIVLPARPHEPFTSMSGMLFDLHRKYGSDRVPLEQAKALVADAPAEMVANYGDEQLRRLAFKAEWMARMYVLGSGSNEAPEQVTKRYVTNALKRRYDAAKPTGG